MKDLLKRLVDAVCVLPLTAGKQSRNDNTGDDRVSPGLDGTVTGPFGLGNLVATKFGELREVTKMFMRVLTAENRCGRLVQRRRASNQTDVLLSLNTTSSNDIDRRTRKFISISLAVIMNMPAVVLHILNIINEQSITEFASTIYNVVQQFVILYLNLRCFYMMKRQCELPIS
ncbi:unnamed protein product [Mytilus edulis]|uniref:Uncharacterized protein n=1 Tax=Mytilus edulis TaxID=6550 RepID=A0A8S3S567_MYTED|nr:unnamed protein product [Mytilus edulis]